MTQLRHYWVYTSRLLSQEVTQIYAHLYVLLHQSLIAQNESTLATEYKECAAYTLKNFICEKKTKQDFLREVDGTENHISQTKKDKYILSHI